KEYLCNICKDAGGSMVMKKAGEKTFYKDIDGTIKETTLRFDTEEWKECECAKIRKINRLIKSSEITEEFQKMGFTNFDTTGVVPEIARMKETALMYYNHFDQIKSSRINSCLFNGQPGCGKTHLLTAISNNLMHKKQVPVLYFPFRDGVNNISANGFEKKDDIIQQMKQVDVLFIDDLFKPIGGKQTAKDWMVEIIFEVVNHRYLNKLPILVSTELTFEQLVMIDEALASRIFEMSSDFTSVVPHNMMNNYRLRKLQGGA
ncbi:MAG: DnaA/Hda family protein, partial [Psychrobacillus sp.]